LVNIHIAIEFENEPKEEKCFELKEMSMDNAKLILPVS